MYKNIKWTEIITEESQITKNSALYIIPIDGFTCKLIYVDDDGQRRVAGTSSGGTSRFIELTDVPLTYLNNANKTLKVNASETGLEFTDISSGADGKSAYEIAVENGFQGTEVEWLLSLKGDTGDSGQDGESANININSTSTLNPNEPAYVVNIGTTQDVLLNFGIPKGEKGEPGEDGSIDLLTFNVNDDMHLIMQLETNTDLNFILDDNGHLILTN